MLPPSDSNVNRIPPERLSPSDSIRALDLRRLERQAKSLKAGLGGDRLRPGVAVRVEGHPDPFGTGAIKARRCSCQDERVRRSRGRCQA